MTTTRDEVARLVDYTYGWDNKAAARSTAFLITAGAAERIAWQETGRRIDVSRGKWQLVGLPIVLTTDPPDPMTRR